MPDWKNPLDYPNESAPLDVWRWEFLRRNTEYRKDFHALSQDELQQKWGLSWLCGPDDDGTTMDALVDSEEGPYTTKVTIHPGTSHLRTLGDGDVWKPERRHDDELHPLNRSQVAIVFDCTLPIARQIEAAKDYLEQKRNRLPGVSRRLRTNLYPTYLRVLDATAAGVGKSKMAEVMGLPNDYPDYQGDKTVTNWLNAANALVNGGYRNI